MSYKIYKESRIMSRKKVLSLVSIILAVFVTLGTLPVYASMSDEAAAISVNSAVTDNLPTYNTVKYYKVELAAPGKVYLSFDHSNIENDATYWKVAMFDSVENIVIEFESAGNNTTGKSKNAYVDKGTYYVRVTGTNSFYFSDKDYRLTVNYTENKGEYEIEQNNDKESATKIAELNKPVTGNIRVYTDVDYYQFTLQNPGMINLGFAHSNIEKDSPYWNITVFDSVDSNVLDFESTGINTNGKSMNAYLDKGTYYVRVKAVNSFYHHNADYSLTVNYVKNNGNYEIEPNDSKAQATSISEFNRPVTGNIRTYSDIDYFKFTVPSSGRISLGFNHGNVEKYSSYWKISLFDSNDKELLQMESQGTETVTKSKEIKLDKGTYYVRVTSKDSFYHSKLDYSLSINSPDFKPPIKVLLNGEQIQFDQQPIIQNGRTLVPLRAIFEAMGATVEWDQKTQTVTAKSETVTVVMKVGDKTMTKNGTKITLDVPPQIVNNRTLVPARAVAESFGADVKWDGATQTVIITQ